MPADKTGLRERGAESKQVDAASDDGWDLERLRSGGRNGIGDEHGCLFGGPWALPGRGCFERLATNVVTSERSFACKYWWTRRDRTADLLHAM